MADSTLLVMARRDGRYIAGALNFIGGDTLFGRNWGCLEDHPYLHFELCYYQAIDFAISRGLSRVEAGAQGTHKLARGYEPVRTHSAHYIPHEGFRAAIEDYLEQERRHVENDMSTLAGYTPFKKANDNDKDNEGEDK
jgi:predicted N-acyltransferase